MSRATERTAGRQCGLTLVELVISIVIISIAVTGVLMAYSTMVARSADPLIDVQAVAIAEAYMDEILAKPVAGPVGGGGRATYATVGEYAGLSEPPTDQFGAALAGLGAYTVAVTIGGSDLGIGATGVQVTVAHTSGRSVTLRGHRIDF